MAKNEVEYTAKLFGASINTANSNLDGTGTLYSIITGGGQGIDLSRVYIHAKDDVSEGMVRLFLDDGSNTRLIREVKVKAVDQRSVTPAFGAIVKFEPKLFIPNGWSLKASTQNSDVFRVIAVGLQWDYPASETNIEYSSAIKTAVVSTANSNLNGSGTLTTLITGANNGTQINNITIKATGSTTEGMIRLFFSDGVTGNPIFMEIPVPANTQSSVSPAFTKVVNFIGGLPIPNGFMIKASTENAETFILTTNAVTWNYV